MREVRGFREVPDTARGAVLAIGNFDGVHRGHQALLAESLAKGKDFGAAAGVLIFEPHPCEFFHPQEPHFVLTTQAQKLAIFKALGLDLAIVLDFNVELAKLPADAFISSVLIEGLDIRHVVIGHDFFFGRDRSGTPELMQAAADKFGFGLTVVAPVAEGGEAFSSSIIRLRLAHGDVIGAAQMMGRWWRVGGKVIGGAKRGAGLGFPTANVPLTRGTGLGHGIYAVRVYLGSDRYDGAAYLGTRPTYDEGMPVLEVFLFDFSEDLYDHPLEVEFIDFIREDRKFDTSETLIAQMQQDCASARDILRSASTAPRI